MDLIKENILLVLFCIASTKTYIEDNFNEEELMFCQDYHTIVKILDYYSEKKDYLIKK